MEWWAILELPLWSELDYRLWSNTSYRWIPIKMLPSIISTEYQYNQLEFEKDFWINLCTIYAGFTSYSNNRQAKQENRKSLVEKRYKLPDFNPAIWGYIPVAIKMLVDETRDWIFYRVAKEDIKTLLDKGYVVNIWIHWWDNIKEVSKDWKITEEEIKQIKDKKWGHSTCLRYNVRLNSYEWVKVNNKIIIDNIDEFIKNWFVFDWAYVIVPNKVLRDFYNSLLSNKSLRQAEEYFRKIDKELYPREKQIFQWWMQMKYIGKINSPELKNLRF